MSNYLLDLKMNFKQKYIPSFSKFYHPLSKSQKQLKNIWNYCNALMYSMRSNDFKAFGNLKVRNWINKVLTPSDFNISLTLD